MIQHTIDNQKKLVPSMDDYPFGFVILCPEKNIGGLRNTVSSVRKVYPRAPLLCGVGSDVTPAEMTEMSKICKTHVGGETITSIINTGIHKSERPWNVLIFAGSWVTGNVYRKFDLFVKEETDILFPVVDGRTSFVEGSMNGIIIHKRALQEVGNFPDSPMLKMGCNELELVKLLWATDAIDKGFTFKAIIGMKVA